jgi:hypothetical protein
MVFTTTSETTPNLNSTIDPCCITPTIYTQGLLCLHACLYPAPADALLLQSAHQLAVDGHHPLTPASSSGALQRMTLCPQQAQPAMVMQQQKLQLVLSVGAAVTPITGAITAGSADTARGPAAEALAGAAAETKAGAGARDAGIPIMIAATVTAAAGTDDEAEARASAGSTVSTGRRNPAAAGGAAATGAGTSAAAGVGAAAGGKAEAGIATLNDTNGCTTAAPAAAEAEAGTVAEAGVGTGSAHQDARGLTAGRGQKRGGSRGWQTSRSEGASRGLALPQAQQLLWQQLVRMITGTSMPAAAAAARGS